MKIAIVGASESKWTKKQKEKAKFEIRKILITNWHTKKFIHGVLLPERKPILVSGHCPKGGVDIWAEDIANELGIQTEIYSPEVNQWNDKDFYLDFSAGEMVKKKGYRSRNIDIARACDILFDIEPKGKRSGGTWTMEYTKRLSKRVYKVEIK